MLKEMIIKRTISYFFITFLSIFISINASASVLNWKCTNSKNTFSTNYEIDLENKTITHKTSLLIAKQKKYTVNRKPKILSFEEPYAITMNKSKSGNISFKIFNFDRKTYSQSGHSEMCQRCEPRYKKPSSQFYTCVNSDTGSAKWKGYATIQGNNYYFDPDFKDNGSGILYVSELADFSKPNGWGTLSSKITYEVECIMSVYRSLEFTYYKQRMGKGEGRIEKSQSQVWKKAVDIERQHALVEEACSASKRQ